MCIRSSGRYNPTMHCPGEATPFLSFRRNNFDIFFRLIWFLTLLLHIPSSLTKWPTLAWERRDSPIEVSKKNLDTYVSFLAEADNIKDIPPNIAGNAINSNLEGIEYDAEQEELGAAAVNSGNGSVENHYEKFEFYVDSPVGKLPKSGTRNKMDSNITKLRKTLSLVNLTLEESQKTSKYSRLTNYKKNCLKWK